MTITSYAHRGYECFTRTKLLEIAIELRDNLTLHVEPYFSAKRSELRAAMNSKTGLYIK